MHIAICDDSFEYINTVEKYLDSMERNAPYYDVFHSGEEILKAYDCRKQNYDAIFLDMEMSGISGINTGNLIRKMDKHVIIVFVTQHTQYMRECFECTPFRFLIKPMSFEDFKKTLRDIEEKLSEERSTLIFLENREKVRLYCEDIIFLESQSHQLFIYTKERIYRIHKSLSELCRVVSEEKICRVHNSYAVNMAYVKEIKDNEISLYESNAKIPLGRKYKKEFGEKFINYKERKYMLI